MALQNGFLGCGEYGVEWVVVRSKFHVLLVPNYYELRNNLPINRYNRNLYSASVN